MMLSGGGRVKGPTFRQKTQAVSDCGEREIK